MNTSPLMMLRRLHRASTDMGTGISVHNNRLSPGKLAQPIEGEVVSAFTRATHDARMFLQDYNVETVALFRKRWLLPDQLVAVYPDRDSLLTWMGAETLPWKWYAVGYMQNGHPLTRYDSLEALRATAKKAEV